jgi:hypothetical protein
MPGKPRIFPLIFTWAGLSISRIGWARSRRNGGLQSRCGLPGNSVARVVTSAACGSDISSGTGRPWGSAPSLARTINGRISAVAFDNHAAANLTRS